MFAPHPCSSFKTALDEVFVPTRCTGELQPLQVCITEHLKPLMKDSFTRWYASKLHRALDGGKEISDIEVDLCVLLEVISRS